MLTHGSGSPAGARRSQGFTSIEMMVVLVLIGLLAAILAPRLNIRPHLTEAAMQRLGTTLLAAQRAAITRQHSVVVAFDATNRTLRIHYDRDNDGVMEAGERVRIEDLGEGVAFGRGGAPAYLIGSAPVSFTKQQGGLPAVTFHRNGSAGEEGGFYLTSRTAAREGGRAIEARLVVIDRATGRPSWYSYGGSAWKRAF